MPEAERRPPPFSLSPLCRERGTATPLAEAGRRRFNGTMFGLCAGADMLLPAVLGIGAWAACQAAFLPLGYAFWPWRLGSRHRRRRELWAMPFPDEFETLLLKRVPHYRCLDDAGRELFRQRAKLFLDEVTFHGAGVEVTDGLRLRAAAAAVIPSLGFPEWEWPGLKEMIFRPEGYADGSHTDDEGVVTEYEESGMVGVEGVLNGVMMLSSEDLVWEFSHPEDGANVGFHEFAHLMSGGDFALLDAADREKWDALSARERKRIERNDSLLDDYALVDDQEFFAVASEWFFTMPALFREWHRDLYGVLARAYRQEPHRWLEDWSRPAATRRRGRRKRATPASRS